MEETGFDFADVVEDAVQRAGGETATADDIIKCRRSMRLILERWSALRYNTWRIRDISVGAGGTRSILLPKDVDDIISINVNNQPDNFTGVGSEAAMRRIGPDAYSTLTSKDTAGQPSQWYLNRTYEQPQLFIYPIGRTGTTEILNITYVQRPESYTRYGNDMDAPGRWLEALVLCMAADLARKRPMVDGTYNEALIARLIAEAEQAITLAGDNDRSRHNYRFRMNRRR